MSGCVKCFEETKQMSFFIKDEEQLEAYIKIRNRACNLVKKGSDREPLYSENYLKTKEKSYYSKTNTYLNTNKHLSVEIL